MSIGSVSGPDAVVKSVTASTFGTTGPSGTTFVCDVSNYIAAMRL
jgi:hypothetical protein